MTWDDYANKVQAEWKALLDSDAGQGEKPIQRFLETHPSLVPGAQSMSGPSGHSAYPAALIRQPKLPSFDYKIPDFMWIAVDSAKIYAVMIEIEAPKKKWFNKDETPNAKFSQAKDQLTKWRVWFREPRNEEAFLDYYNLPSWRRDRRFVPQFVLIYGRRAEFEGKPNLTKKRANEERESEYFMTFDRLKPIHDSSQYMTIERNKSGYKAVSIPATVQLGPVFSQYRSLISGKEYCVDSSHYMTNERKGFLTRRLAYWDEYGRNPGGLMNSGDRE